MAVEEGKLQDWLKVSLDGNYKTINHDATSSEINSTSKVVFPRSKTNHIDKSTFHENNKDSVTEKSEIED